MFNSSQSQALVERAMLKSALADLDSPAPRVFISSGVLYAILAAAAASGVLLNFVQLPLALSKVLAPFAPLFALGLGMFLMYGLSRTSSKTQFHFLRPYVDKAAIESRLRYLDP